GLDRPGPPVGINDGSTNPFVLRECPPARGGSGVKGGRWPSEERSPLVEPSLSRRRHSRPSTWRCPAAVLEAGPGPGQDITPATIPKSSRAKSSLRHEG